MPLDLAGEPATASAGNIDLYFRIRVWCWRAEERGWHRKNNNGLWP